MARARAALALLLAVGLSACGWTPESPPEYPSGPVTLLTGGTAGVYYAFGVEVARAAELDLDRAPVEVVSTSGSIANLERLADQPGVVAFSALDAAAEAVEGTGPFTEPLAIGALARVYDDFVHVVVRQDSGITSLEDLRGRRVSVGSPGSGVELIAQRLFALAAIDLTADVQARGLSINDSIDALRAGEIEAFVWSGGIPTAGVAELATEVPIRLLPLEAFVTDMRETYSPTYRAGTVPADIYDNGAGVGEAVQTIAVPNVLVTSVDTDPALVRAFTELLFTRRRDIAAQVPLAGALDRRSAIFTSPVPLHPGALRYYRETQR